jgi:hypothetical protein
MTTEERIEWLEIEFRELDAKVNKHQAGNEELQVGHWAAITNQTERIDKLMQLSGEQSHDIAQLLSIASELGPKLRQLRQSTQEKSEEIIKRAAELDRGFEYLSRMANVVPAVKDAQDCLTEFSKFVHQIEMQLTFQLLALDRFVISQADAEFKRYTGRADEADSD